MGKLSDLWHVETHDYEGTFFPVVYSDWFDSYYELLAATKGRLIEMALGRYRFKFQFYEHGPVFDNYDDAIAWAETRVNELNEKSKGPKSMNKKLYMFDDADDTRVFGSISELMAELGMNETKSCVEVTITRKFTLRNQTVEVED